MLSTLLNLHKTNGSTEWFYHYVLSQSKFNKIKAGTRWFALALHCKIIIIKNVMFPNEIFSAAISYGFREFFWLNNVNVCHTFYSRKISSKEARTVQKGKEKKTTRRQCRRELWIDDIGVNQMLKQSKSKFRV